MIDKKIVETVDEWLDGHVAGEYLSQPLAQDWARVSKVIEECGEAIAELILCTGQNPRKPLDPTAYQRLLQELADTAMTGIYAIQHFTKDINKTEFIMTTAQLKHYNRVT